MSSPTPKPHRCLRKLAWFVAFGCILLVALYVFRAPLLTGVAQAWVVDEPVTKADAIVVLGGNPGLRAIEAARLYHQGIAPRIIYMDVTNRAVEFGFILSEREQTRRLLLSNNVPENALVVVGNAVTSTYDESQAVRDWITKAGAKSILITTDLSHTRRALWVFHKQLEKTGAQVYVHAIQPNGYGLTDWWRHEDGLIAFQNEFIKYLYYWVKY